LPDAGETPHPAPARAIPARLTLPERAQLAENDADNAARLLSEHGHRLLYVVGRGWGVWDGARFCFQAGELAAFGVATELRALLAAEADWIAHNLPVTEEEVANFLTTPKGRQAWQSLDPQAEAVRLLRFAAAGQRRKASTAAGNVDRINRALDYARHQCRATVADLDANPLALVCPNGQVDLAAAYRWERPEGCVEEEELAARAAWLQPIDRGALPTRVAGVPYDPTATCPAWEAFVALVMPDPEGRAALQRCLGYLLSGDNPEAACFILRGPGGNGKSTLLNALHHVLGERDGYAATCDIEQFIVTPPKPAGGHNADEVDLPGARAFIATEPAATDVLSMKKIKAWTGGDQRKSRGAFERGSFTWVPRGVPVLSVNRTPKLKDDDAGTRRRLVFIPLEVSLKELPEEARRPAHVVEAEHRAEGSGILNWLLDGWRDYKAQGRLALPEGWRDLRDRLLAGADPVAQFLREMTEPAEGARIPRADFNKAFGVWAEEEGAAAWSSKAVNDAMTERGHVPRKVKGVFGWPGIRWQHDAAPLLERALGRAPAEGEIAPPPDPGPAF
jgi:P4 family phage/plasmid primase-like protien